MTISSQVPGKTVLRTGDDEWFSTAGEILSDFGDDATKLVEPEIAAFFGRGADANEGDIGIFDGFR